MTTFRLYRCSYTGHATFGELYAPTGLPMFPTLELPWKDNHRNISCIPAGVYEVKPYSSAKFKNVWELQDVPGRSKILIHAGNTVDDIEGCILAGMRRGLLKGLPAVLDSRKAIDMARGIFPATGFTLEILDFYNRP